MKKNKKKIKPILLSVFLVLSIACYSLIPFNNKLSIDDENQRFVSPKAAESTPIITWIANGTPISTADDNQGSTQLISDGMGGAIIVWGDSRNSTITGGNIYAQRINPSGVVQWTTNGIPVSPVNYSQGNPQLVSDGAGGAIIAWIDRRDSATGPDIYAQRINSSGDSQWTTNGIPICTASGWQQFPRLVSDGEGGAIIAWRDRRSYAGIYAQRVNSSGDVQWDLDGIPITITSVGDKCIIISDGAGGAIIVWGDNRNSATTGWDIYAQRINSSGDVQWTTNGIPVCMANDRQGGPQLVSDGAGGAIIVWGDVRNSTISDKDIYSQRINSSGDVQWTTNGIQICTAYYDQVNPQITNDGAGGAIITWSDFRASGYYDPDIYAQRISSSGIIQWTANGIVVSDAIENQESPRLVSDSLGGVVIVWIDSRNNGGSYITDIYIQKLNSTGHPQWIEDGIPICTIDDMQQAPELINDGLGNVIIVWEDDRVSGWEDTDIYAQRVIHNTIPSSNHPGFINTSVDETETIGWILKDDDSGGNYRVLINSTVYQDWQSWISDTPLNVSINHSVAGIFNYTIEYYDNYDKYGVPDSVIVNILNTTTTPGDLTEDDSKNNNPSISFGYSFIFPMIFGMLLITYVARRKYILQKKSSKNG